MMLARKFQAQAKPTRATRASRSTVKVSAYKVTLKTPSGTQTIECPEDTYILVSWPEWSTIAATHPSRTANVVQHAHWRASHWMLPVVLALFKAPEALCRWLLESLRWMRGCLAGRC
jgi:hypothetical protein